MVYIIILGLSCVALSDFGIKIHFLPWFLDEKFLSSLIYANHRRFTEIGICLSCQLSFRPILRINIYSDFHWRTENFQGLLFLAGSRFFLVPIYLSLGLKRTKKSSLEPPRKSKPWKFSVLQWKSEYERVFS